MGFCQNGFGSTRPGFDFNSNSAKQRRGKLGKVVGVDFLSYTLDFEIKSKFGARKLSGPHFPK